MRWTRFSGMPSSMRSMKLGTAGVFLQTIRSESRFDSCKKSSREILRQMCKRHGLPPDFGERLLPLVRRALQAPDDVRQRILALVENNLARKADAEQKPKPLSEVDQAVLVAVARVLHDWDPSSSILDLGRKLGDVDPDSGEAA